MLADLGGFADHDAGAVVDEEVVADLRAGVDVDAGAAVGPLGHHAGNERDVELVELVGQAIDGDRFQAGVAEDHFVERLAGRVAVVGGLDVGGQIGPAARECVRGTASSWPGRGLRKSCGESQSSALADRTPASWRRRAADLRGEPIVQPVDQLADVEADVAAVEALAPAIAGIEDFGELGGGGDDLVVIGKRAVAEVVDLADVVVGTDDPLGELGQLVFETEVGRHGRNAPGVGHALGWLAQWLGEVAAAEENGDRKKAPPSDEAYAMARAGGRDAVGVRRSGRTRTDAQAGSEFSARRSHGRNLMLTVTIVQTAIQQSRHGWRGEFRDSDPLPDASGAAANRDDATAVSVRPVGGQGTTLNRRKRGVSRPFFLFAAIS